MKKLFLLMFLLIISFINIFSQNRLYSLEELMKMKVYTSFSEAIADPENVVVLNVDGGFNSVLPAGFEKIKNLQWVRIAEAELFSIPEYFWQNTNIQYLDLSGNRLKKFPAQIQNLPNLMD